MEVLRNLFEGYPNLWGGGVAHSVLILSLTIAFGIILAKIKENSNQVQLHCIYYSTIPQKMQPQILLIFITYQ